MKKKNKFIKKLKKNRYMQLEYLFKILMLISAILLLLGKFRNIKLWTTILIILFIINKYFRYKRQHRFEFLWIGRKDKKLAIVLTVIILIILLLIFKPFLPLSIVFVAEEKEPTSIFQCNQLKGICIPVEQEVRKGYESFGSCSPSLNCIIPSQCLETGGKWKYDYVKIDSKSIFEKKCICPQPLTYELGIGCTKIFK